MLFDIYRMSCKTKQTNPLPLETQVFNWRENIVCCYIFCEVNCLAQGSNTDL